MTKVVRIEHDNGEEVQVEETSLTQLAQALATVSEQMNRERCGRLNAEEESNGWRRSSWRWEDTAIAYKERFHECMVVAAAGWILAAVLIVARFAR